jgi:hypothetical protein
MRAGAGQLLEVEPDGLDVAELGTKAAVDPDDTGDVFGAVVLFDRRLEPPKRARRPRGMQFFLCEVVARIVAAYLCFDCWRRLRNGLAEGKITYTSNSDMLAWLIFDSSAWVARRASQPFRYWMQMGLQAIALVACLVVAINGWWHPTS